MWHDNETTQDLLGFKVHSNLIKEVITQSGLLPVSIGVFGDWGSGKSSIMRMLEKDLKSIEGQKVVSLYFNGWTFDGYDDAKAALIESILKAVSKHEKVSERGKKSAKKLLKSVDVLRATSFLFKNLAPSAIKAYATGGTSLITDARKLIKFLSKVSTDPEEFINEIKSDENQKKLTEAQKILKKTKSTEKPQETVRTFRDKFEKTIDKCDIDCLVVLIDDLDRCAPDRIIENLEAIKLFLNVKKTAFVIGADERIVRHAIQHRYKAKDLRESELENYEQLVNDYLEKLIQVPYILPKLSESEVETYMSLLICKRDVNNTFEHVVEGFRKFREQDKYSVFGYSRICEIIPDQKDQLGQLTYASKISPLITESLKGNPRLIKRFLNAFTLRRKLAHVANFTHFKDEILVKLMILEYLDKKKFGELYKMQLEGNGYPQIIKEVEKDESKTQEVLEENYSEWNKSRIVRWFKVEPLLSDVDLRDYFWLSRDKISASISSSSLVPPIVKRCYGEIISIPANTQIDRYIENIDTLFDSVEYQEHLLDLLKKGLIKDPSCTKHHRAFFAFINHRDIGITEYEAAIKEMPSQNKIKAAVGNQLYMLEQQGKKVGGIIESLLPNSRVLKAYQQKQVN